MIRASQAGNQTWPGDRPGTLEVPVSDVYTHVQTMNSCHLCAIAARLGRTVKWDPKSEKIVGDEQAAAFFARVPRKGYEIPRV